MLETFRQLLPDSDVYTCARVEMIKQSGTCDGYYFLNGSGCFPNRLPKPRSDGCSHFVLNSFTIGAFIYFLNIRDRI